MIDDAFKASWQQQLYLLIHEYQPRQQTLLEVSDKLEAVCHFLEPLSGDVEAERERGLFIATLAIRYGLGTLEHFGLVDGPEPPMPIHLDQAKQAVGNLLLVVRDEFQTYQTAMREAEEPDGIRDASRPDAPTDDGEDTADDHEFILDQDRFSVRYRGKECPLGNTKPFAVLKRLNEHRLAISEGFLPLNTLMDDVWGTDGMIEPATVQKTVSNLRKKLEAAGLGDDIIIDGDQTKHYRLIVR